MKLESLKEEIASLYVKTSLRSNDFLNVLDVMKPLQLEYDTQMWKLEFIYFDRRLLLI